MILKNVSEVLILVGVLAAISCGLVPDVSQKPNVTIDSEPLIQTELRYKLKGTIYDKDSKVDKYWWVFGDGKQSIPVPPPSNCKDSPCLVSIEHQYPAPADYEASLNAMDDTNLVGVNTTTVSVRKANTFPEAHLRVCACIDDPQYDCEDPMAPCAKEGPANLEVVARAGGSKDSDGDQLTYFYDFNVADGISLDESTGEARYLYTLDMLHDQEEVTFDIVLEVRDTRGGSSRDYGRITVKRSDP